MGGPRTEPRGLLSNRALFGEDVLSGRLSVCLWPCDSTRPCGFSRSATTTKGPNDVAGFETRTQNKGINPIERAYARAGYLDSAARVLRTAIWPYGGLG